MGSIKTKGVCKLTGCFGPFVKSHILPLALTNLYANGEKFVEAGMGLGVKHRSSSWYDTSLVVREGEDILASIDDKGIRQLRKHALIWGSRSGESMEVDSPVERPIGRQVAFTEPEILQLFFLSLLWRAAASQREEFHDISLDPRILEDVRLRVAKQQPGRLEDYPIFLFQIASKGVIHNRTPLMEHRGLPLASGATQIVPYVRFYFDGLVAHVNIAHCLELDWSMIGPCSVGFAEKTLVFAHSFDESRAFANLKEMFSVVSAELRCPPVPRSTVASAALDYVASLRKNAP